MTVRHPDSPPDACSMLWDDGDLPAAGSAARADFWVALEQSGPWGRDAITESHLDPALGAELARRCSDAGGRLLLIREPGGHADHHNPDAPRRALVTGSDAAIPWLVTGTIDAPAQLLDLPFDQLARGSAAAVSAALPQLQPSARPALLVCTNGRRDVCCAVRGRPVALAAADARRGQVWECSHTGGHRFAPTGITLPSGHAWARLTGELAVAALDAEGAGEIAGALNSVRHNRGRSCLPPAAQAAEAWWRAEQQEHRLGGIAWASKELDDETRVRLTPDDGHAVTITVRQVDAPGEWRDSCGKQIGPTRTWQIEPIEGATLVE